jgi:hypothetical protein
MSARKHIPSISTRVWRYRQHCVAVASRGRLARQYVVPAVVCRSEWDVFVRPARLMYARRCLTVRSRRRWRWRLTVAIGWRGFVRTTAGQNA